MSGNPGTAPRSCRPMIGRGVVLLLGLVALALPTAALAQADTGTPLVTGRSYRLDSPVLGESRVIDVAVPAGYEANLSQRYPVLYVLDGEVESAAAITITRFYASTGQLPPMIVVGVRNTDRTRDLTPAAVAGFRLPPEARTAGGADRFLRFLANDLAPWVEGRYRAAPMRVLVGHSLGGLFALHALATRPQLFTGYLVMEPATWWNNGHERTAAGAALRQPATRQARVILVNTESLEVDTTGFGGDQPMVRYLRLSGETHSSMALAGMMLGLRTMFADFQLPRWVPGTRPVTMLEHYDLLSRRLGFAVPIPGMVFEQVIRMSIHARQFEDAAQVLDRLEREQGQSADTRDLRQLLADERASPVPAGLVPLQIPAHRPTPREADRFLGRWVLIGAAGGHEVEIRAAGDTIVVHERVQLPDGEWDEDDAPVIGLTSGGDFEWGQRVFRGIAALLVLRGHVMEDGTMTVTREVRGWVPRGPTGDMLRVERLRRVAP
jgi:predicted alpha/beta superfamily hydrolase